MDKIEKNQEAPKKTNVVFVHDELPDEVRCKLQAMFPNATFQHASAATGDEAAQINATEPAPPEPRAEELTKLRFVASDAGCPMHESVLSDKSLKGTPIPKKIEEWMRSVAYATLKDIAGQYGLCFNEQELDALYRLSLAFDPPLAMAVANSACRKFLNHWGN